MKNPDYFLTRLFSLARRAPAAEVSPVAFGLETAVLAHWREAAGHRRENGTLLRGLRWAALLACAAASMAAVVENDELIAFRDRFDPATRLADSAIAMSYGYE